MPKHEWLTLTQAAARLSVHPSTLRRWADDGAIPIMLTPGGHRRFALADLDTFSQSQRISSATDVQPLWAENVIRQTRSEIQAHPPSALAAPSSEMRLTFRELGRRLVGLAMQFVALDDDGEDILHDARAIGAEYARIGRLAGMSLTDALQASMFFHDQLLETSLQQPDGSRVRSETSRLILRRVNTLLTAVHLAIAAAYEAQSG